MKRPPEHIGTKTVIADIAIQTLPNPNPNTARQYEQKRSKNGTYNEIKTEITYRKIIKYALVFFFGGIMLNFLLAFLMGKI